MKKLICVFLTLFVLLALAVPAMAATGYVIDKADLLTPSQEQQLQEKLAAVSKTLGMDIVVATTNDTGYQTSMSYADDLFDYSGYGADGVLWLIDMDNRKSTISTAGRGIKALSDSDQDAMQDVLSPMLSDGEYFDAAMRFAALCQRYCGVNWGLTVGISLAVGLVIALIATSVMKGQLNNVQLKAGAADYLKPGSLNITESRDLFLYRHISRQARPKDSSSGTHRSSSGRSHGGSSRSF